MGVTANQRIMCVCPLMSFHPDQLEGRDCRYCSYTIYTSAVCVLRVCVARPLAYVLHLATGWTCKQEQQQVSGGEEMP